jgi:hypothetical protein
MFAINETLSFNRLQFRVNHKLVLGSYFPLLQGVRFLVSVCRTLDWCCTPYFVTDQMLHQNEPDTPKLCHSRFLFCWFCCCMFYIRSVLNCFTRKINLFTTSTSTTSLVTSLRMPRELHVCTEGHRRAT